MKNKKILVLMMALVFVFALAACGNNDTSSTAETDSTASVETSTEAPATSSEEASASTETPANVTLGENDLYLITDLGTIDDKSFNQGSFEGLDQYAKEAGLAEAKYIRPAGDGEQVYDQAIDQAIAAGAKVVVTPGYLFDKSIGKAQVANPDVKFVAVDFVPVLEDGTAKATDNTVSLTYKEQQAGFLAGYAAVKDGYTKLGFMGGIAVPAVKRYGYGFIDGANVAAEELGITVEMKYHYTGSFIASPDIATMAASWYQEGTEVIFSCGGGIYSSITASAEAADKKVIGVDVDQKDQSETIITSAMKSLKSTVYDAVKSAIEGGFQGGQSLVLGVEHNAVQISDDFSRFNTFTKADYDAIYEKLLNNVDGITDAIPTEATGDSPEAVEAPNVTLTYIQ